MRRQQIIRRLALIDQKAVQLDQTIQTLRQHPLEVLPPPPPPSEPESGSFNTIYLEY